jgi:uracil-DNA glycosylase family 4
MARRIFHDDLFDQPLVVSRETRLQHNEERRQKILASRGVYPLDAPGVPLLKAKSAFLHHAEALSASDPTPANVDIADRVMQSKELVERSMARVLWGRYEMRVPVANYQDAPATFIPGVHREGISGPSAIGPAPADIMIVNKIAGPADGFKNKSFCGRDAQLLEQYIGRLEDLRDARFYMTNLLKFVPPDKKNRITAAWKGDSRTLLMQEILLVRPRYILCLGTEVARTILDDSSVKVLEMNIVDFTYNVAFASDEEPLELTTKLFVLPHPSQVLRDPSAERQIESGLMRFSAIRAEKYTADAGSLERIIVETKEQLLAALIRAETDPQKKDDVVAVDAEWHGEHPVNTGSYMRTIQFAWLPGRACGIKICEAGGAVVQEFSGVGARGLDDSVRNLLNAYFLGGSAVFLGETHTFRPKRIVGHFFNADLEWLVEYGLDLRSGFKCPIYDLPLNASTPRRLATLYRRIGFSLGDTVPAWFRTKYEGGADTGLMAHAVEETASFKLEDLATRYTSAPKYEAALVQWRDAYCKQMKLQGEVLEGYGECPDDVLLPYGMFDADVTLRLFYRFSTLLDSDYHGMSCREAFWESQIATPAVLEIHQTGLLFDPDRFDSLAASFADARDRLLQVLRGIAAWPDFNPRSSIHAKEFLFGYEFNGKRDPLTRAHVKVRPNGARSLKLRPICDTSKPPKPWDQIVKDKEEDSASVAANQKVLSTLFHQQNPGPKKVALRCLLDYRFMSQAISTTLQEASLDEETSQIVYDDAGIPVYEKGLASYLCSDGRIRTHMYQTKETGRWSSARPNLQNISKKRDKDYARILEDGYKHKIRSVFKALPGHVIVEADYIGAELFAMAVLAGDDAMIAHATRNQLPEDHPDYYDIHSNIAVLAFKLACPPTKKGLEAIKKEHLRIVAKSVVFGCAYGRGAKAIAVAAEEEGIALSVEEAQAVINTIFALYPRLAAFFEECRSRAAGTYFEENAPEPSPRVITNSFGRRRRFPVVLSDGTFFGEELKRRMIGEYGRQAMNFPVQSLVASVVSRAAGYFAAYKELPGVPKDLFKITLQIHDALVFQVPFEHIRTFCEKVLPYCMRQRVPIWPTRLDGAPIGTGPYYLGIEAEVMESWGEKLKPERATELGLPHGGYSHDGCMVHYCKH